MAWNLIRARQSAIWTVLVDRLRRQSLSRLSPHEKFILAGGDEILWALKPKGAVLVLGGYTGTSTVRYAQTSSKVISLEPVEVFRSEMIARTANIQNVICLDFAASDQDGSLVLRLSGDETSNSANAKGSAVEVASRDILSIVEEYGPFELLECNIEGGEYSVLPRLTDSSAINSIEKVLVQFHDIGPQTEDVRAEAHRGLSRTHIRAWNYDLVWELWVRF